MKACATGWKPSNLPRCFSPTCAYLFCARRASPASTASPNARGVGIKPRQYRTGDGLAQRSARSGVGEDEGCLVLIQGRRYKYQILHEPLFLSTASTFIHLKFATAGTDQLGFWILCRCEATGVPNRSFRRNERPFYPTCLRWSTPAPATLRPIPHGRSTRNLRWHHRSPGHQLGRRMPVHGKSTSSTTARSTLNTPTRPAPAPACPAWAWPT